jgi:hypothetical protein
MMKLLTFVFVIAASTPALAQDQFRLQPSKLPGKLTAANDSNMTYVGDAVILYKQDTIHCKSFTVKDYRLTELAGVKMITSSGMVIETEKMHISDTAKWFGFKASPFPLR